MRLPTDPDTNKDSHKIKKVSQKVINAFVDTGNFIKDSAQIVLFGVENHPDQQLLKDAGVQGNYRN